MSLLIERREYIGQGNNVRKRFAIAGAIAGLLMAGLLNVKSARVPPTPYLWGAVVKPQPGIIYDVVMEAKAYGFPKPVYLQVDNSGTRYSDWIPANIAADAGVGALIIALGGFVGLAIGQLVHRSHNERRRSWGHCP
jgi:hypothetical protein